MKDEGVLDKEVDGVVVRLVDNGLEVIGRNGEVRCRNGKYIPVGIE